MGMWQRYFLVPCVLLQGWTSDYSLQMHALASDQELRILSSYDFSCFENYPSGQHLYPLLDDNELLENVSFGLEDIMCPNDLDLKFTDLHGDEEVSMDDDESQGEEEEEEDDDDDDDEEEEIDTNYDDEDDDIDEEEEEDHDDDDDEDHVDADDRGKFVEHRCRPDPNAIDAWAPGDLDKMFEKLTVEPFKTQYSVNVLSSPKTNGPWIVTLDDVFSQEEALRLIEYGYIFGHERSMDVGDQREDGTYENDVNDGRTSSNAWCVRECSMDDHIVAVVDRISNITGLPQQNSEHIQLLKYEVGEFYQIHHDLIPHHVERMQGPRILTAFLYLNDVAAGGGTNFDQYNVTVIPRRGRVVLWPSTLNESPIKPDWRTTHQALPVVEGVKYGANFWFHLRDWNAAIKARCM